MLPNTLDVNTNLDEGRKRQTASAGQHSRKQSNRPKLIKGGAKKHPETPSVTHSRTRMTAIGHHNQTKFFHGTMATDQFKSLQSTQGLDMSSLAATINNESRVIPKKQKVSKK